MENKESYRQQQENELEVIKSIFGNDVHDMREPKHVTGWKPMDLVITLLPQKGSSGNREAYVKANLHIICPSKYPKVSPKIALEETKGLSDVQKTELLIELNGICEEKKGEVVIYDLAQSVQAFLHKHNKAPCGSFYDQMLIERNKRDEALLQQQAQRLSREQRLIRDEVLKRKEILRNEDRWRREVRRSMSEQSPKHRSNSSAEMVDNPLNQSNGCELHLTSEDLYFPAVGRKILRGCCLGHSQNGCIAYSGIDTESGQLLYITEWTFKYSQLESKCTLNCKNDPNKCNGHSIDEIVNCIETEMIYLSQIRHKNLVSYEAVLCLRRKEGVILYLMQDFVHGTSVNCISNSLGWSYSGVGIIAKGILDALIYLHNKGISHSNIDDCSVFMDNSGTCRVSDFSFISYLNYLMGESKDGKQTGCDLPALGHLIESLLQLPSPDMFDFIEQCKSERTLTASDLLEHPFLSPNQLEAVNKLAPICIPEKRVTDLPMHSSIIPSGRTRLETEFEVLQWLGQGAYGDVLKVKNILDNRQYAIKRIPLTARSRQIFKKMTREVELLSRLNHENVVRYFNSWIENANESDLRKYAQNDGDGESESASSNAASDNQLSVISDPDEITSNDWLGSPLRPDNTEFSSDSIQFLNTDGDENDDDDDDDDESQPNEQQICRSPKYQLQIMYIQMEFCEKSTLRSAIDDNLYTNTERLWRLFREICEGLAHIHSQGMIHRDLKPVNIFLDSRDQVKIGDFGLATTSFLALQQNHEVSLSHNRGEISSSHTGKVGTALYVAPELMGKAANSKYNQKVDLYSLGIIFFEMCHRPFSTGMERVEILAALRSPSITISAWMASDPNHNQAIQVIKWLLNHDQNKRPSAEELLASDLLPPARLEDNELQEMLRNVLANPQSKSYKHLVARCLAQQSDTILELTYHLGLVQTNPKLEYIKRQIVSLFHKHGAIEVVTPLLSPYVKSTKSTAVRLMTHSGSIVVLPHDLRVPFIKHIAISGINLMRRYSVGRVYREKKVFNFHPKQMYECAFDIIAPSSAADNSKENRLIDAELISIGYELTHILPILKQRNLTFRVNHTSLLNAILINYNVPTEKYNDVFAAVLDYNDRRISKFQLQSTLSALLELSKPNVTNLVESLITEIALSSPKAHYANGSNLRNLIRGQSEVSRLAREGMQEVEKIVALSQSLGVVCPISLNAGLAVGYDQAKSGGIIWQLICDFKNKNHQGCPYVLGVGGRYNYMLSEYQKQAHNRGVTVPNRNISGAGLSFALDKILSVLNASHTDDTKKTDVVVCVSGIRPNFRDVTQILRALWSSGIQCAVVQATSPEDGQDMAKDLGAIYYVVCTEDGCLRVRSWINDRFEERLLNRDEIIAYIKKALRSAPDPEPTVSQTPSLSEINKNNRSNANIAGLTLPALDIKFNTLEKTTASSRKRHENVLTSHMFESLLLFNKHEQIVVFVVELPPMIIRAITSVLDPRGNPNSKEIDTEIAAVIDRFPNYKRYIRDVIEEITDTLSEKKRVPVVCLYGLKDSYFRFIL